MKTVTRFEADLLTVVDYFLGRVRPELALPVLFASRTCPKGIGGRAAQLLRERLAGGTVAWLMRHLGWTRTVFPTRNGLKEGRVWERFAPDELGLRFSRNSIQFLLWVTANHAAEVKDPWLPRDELTTGDAWLLFLAYSGLRMRGAGGWIRLSPFAENALCRLAFATDFRGDSLPQVEFEPWLEGVGLAFFEMLQPFLADRWTEMEQSNRQVTDWRRLRSQGRAQELVLQPFFDRLEAADRRDLAGFLLRAAGRVLPAGVTSRDWIGALDPTGVALRERNATYQMATSFLRSLERLAAWQREARSVGFLDEGYAVRQWWKSEWERHDGDAIVERARSVVGQLNPISGTPGGAKP